MPTSFSKPDNRQGRSRRVVAALLIYGAICVGLLGYFLTFPVQTTQRSQAEKRLNPDHVQYAKKQGRYEGVIENWNRYRARDARADAR